MGALHEGHLALVDEARRHADVVVVSIFVNPLQFGANEDLARYPRTLEQDAASLREHGVTLLFAPTAEEMYAQHRTVRVTAAPHDAVFEGAIRPEHFTGVLTVVTKLFNIVSPDVAVFGQKDLQQISLIRAMVRDLNIPVQVVVHPTIREPDGLAMSSRNRYLDAAQRADAVRLSAALGAVQQRFAGGEHDARVLTDAGRRELDTPGISVDYLDIVDPDTFTTVSTAAPGAAVIVAARVGTTRLIDNILL